MREAGANWQMESGAERKTRAPRHTERGKTSILLSDHLQSTPVNSDGDISDYEIRLGHANLSECNWTVVEI